MNAFYVKHIAGREFFILILVAVAVLVVGYATLPQGEVTH